MFGISSAGKEAINRIVEDIFDRIALQLIGSIPRLAHKKHLIISSQPNLGLANLFIQSMANKTPNVIEADALKSMLESSHGYLESLKQRTRSNVAESVDGLAKQAQIKKDKVSKEALDLVINEEMEKAKSHLQTIVEAESTKVRNVGFTMDLTRVASSIGDMDPTVFFSMVRDNVTCKTCIELHLMPDGVTPRVYRFSELKQGYHKRGETQPSAFGEHPGCRCVPVYLARGFGFNSSGHVTYIGQNHDEFAKQRKL